MVERFDLVQYEHFDQLDRAVNGDWVRYSDHLAIIGRIEDEHTDERVQWMAELSALKKQVEELTAERDEEAKCVDYAEKDFLKAIARAESAEAEAAAALRKALREDWHGVVLDGRNEHGSHVLMLPHRSIELEQDENGDFIKYLAETILQDAERLGFSIGDAVVATFDACTDEGFFSHYEYTGVSSLLTEHLYGPPEEQQSARAALSAVKEV
jgi:hypothetical protein